MAAADDVVVPREQLHKFVVDFMISKGASLDHADILADNLVMADYRGHYSHGINSVDVYGDEIATGTACGGGKSPVIIKETVSTALVNGNDLIGAVVGKFCMELAAKKAKETGIGMVTTRGSNHFGFAGWYSLLAAENNLLGFAFTNSSPVVTVTRSKDNVLGSNPISFTAPGKEGDNFVLDMATSVVAHGKTVVQKRKGLSMPDGWAIDQDGNETTDPNNVSALLPLGGQEESSGYKGYGLGMMVEILCSVLAGSNPSPFARMWRTYEKPADLAHCFIAINPEAFADGFSDRLSTLMNHCRNLKPVNKDKKVLVAGDPEKQHMDLCDKLGGIPYHVSQIAFLNNLAEDQGIPTLKGINEK